MWFIILTSHHVTTSKSNVPIFSERALQVLGSLLVNQAEPLPLLNPNKRMYAINVIEMVDALDYEHSDIEWIEGHPGVLNDVRKFVFKPEAFAGSIIFKIPEYKKLLVFVTDVFKEVVEANKLNGFSFELLWDSEADGSAEAEMERKYREELAAVECNKGEEFPFAEAERRLEAGGAVASGKWRLQKAGDDSIRLGNLQADGRYKWIRSLFYPPILLDLMWHAVEVLAVD